jgi:GNAT superfamily N-acetyltransferase
MNLVLNPPCEIVTELSDDRTVCLRTIRPSDRARIRDGISEMSDHSRYMRFFSAFRDVPESVLTKLSAVDGHDHIGWGVILVDEDDCPPIAAAHAIRSKSDPSFGELAVAVLDEYHRLGVAQVLLAAVLNDCANENLMCLEMQILGENHAAASLVRRLGAQRKSAALPEQTYTLDVYQALEILGTTQQPKGVSDVMQRFRKRIVSSAGSAYIIA